ncbi:MAG: hypothetical protein EOP09_03005 [Proteobacteria bacterium]|nr:MAG: hypothetical protein EOP09_03005 [Pseudomonadota bacterium]
MIISHLNVGFRVRDLFRKQNDRWSRPAWGIPTSSWGGTVALYLGLIAGCLPGRAYAWQFPATEAATQSLYQQIKTDYEARPVWSNGWINRSRNGVNSPYVDSSDWMSGTHAEIVPDEVISVIPEAQFLSYSLFSQAVRGMRAILANFPSAGIRNELLTIVDFDQKTEGRRFYVLNLKTGRMLFQTWAQHGSNSDEDRDRLPELFSNINGSFQSSLGFVLTSETPYNGSFGYSLRMHGIDENLNSLVHSRAIVFHPWPTMHPRGVAQLDAGNTSLGCIALPYYESGRFYGMADQPLSRLIVDTIKGRSVVFVSSSTVNLNQASAYLTGTGKLSAATRDRILKRITREGATRMLMDAEAPEVPQEYRDWLGRRD